MEGFHRVLGGLSFLVLKYLRTTNLKCSHDEEQRLEKVTAYYRMCSLTIECAGYSLTIECGPLL